MKNIWLEEGLWLTNSDVTVASSFNIDELELGGCTDVEIGITGSDAVPLPWKGIVGNCTKDSVSDEILFETDLVSSLVADMLCVLTCDLDMSSLLVSSLIGID